MSMKKERVIRTLFTLILDIIYLIVLTLSINKLPSSSINEVSYQEVWLGLSIFFVFLGSLFLFNDKLLIRLIYFFSDKTPRFTETGVIYKIFYYVFNYLLIGSGFLSILVNIP